MQILARIVGRNKVGLIIKLQNGNFLNLDFRYVNFKYTAGDFLILYIENKKIVKVVKKDSDYVYGLSDIENKINHYFNVFRKKLSGKKVANLSIAVPQGAGMQAVKLLTAGLLTIFCLTVGYNVGYKLMTKGLSSNRVSIESIKERYQNSDDFFEKHFGFEEGSVIKDIQRLYSSKDVSVAIMPGVDLKLTVFDTDGSISKDLKLAIGAKQGGTISDASDSYIYFLYASDVTAKERIFKDLTSKANLIPAINTWRFENYNIVYSQKYKNVENCLLFEILPVLQGDLNKDLLKMNWGVNLDEFNTKYRTELVSDVNARKKVYDCKNFYYAPWKHYTFDTKVMFNENGKFFAVNFMFADKMERDEAYAKLTEKFGVKNSIQNYQGIMIGGYNKSILITNSNLASEIKEQVLQKTN